MISLVVAMGKNRVIGKDGWMPWSLPEDLKFFRSLTLHQHIVMGRTTFETMKKPLPDRFTYVTTRQSDYNLDFENVEVCHDFDLLLKRYKEGSLTLYVCGGAKVYEHALPYVDEMWISLVDDHYEGDTYFPEWDKDAFEVISKEQKTGFTIYHYKRKVTV